MKQKYKYVGFWDLRELGENSAFPCFNNETGSTVCIPADKLKEVEVVNEEDFLIDYHKFKKEFDLIHDGHNNPINLEII